MVAKAPKKRSSAKPQELSKARGKRAKSAKQRAGKTPARSKATPRLPISERVRRAFQSLVRGAPALKRLLSAEKRRRGLRDGDLVFIGMHNVAQLLWCPMQAVLKSRRGEVNFFSAYLSDRVHYACAAGLVARVPETDDEWLQVGDALDLSTVERVRREAAAEEARRQKRLGYSVTWTMEKPDSDDPKSMGLWLESKHAEEYPSTRWNFAWDRYVVLGVPDGLTAEFVYEFKTSGKRQFIEEDIARAFAQADLYGVFFGRKEKRVQILVKEDGKTETRQVPTDVANATRILERFRDVDRGQEVPPRPASGKCRKCEFKETCPLLDLGDGWRAII